MFQIQGEHPYHHLYTRVFMSGKDATPEGTAECTDSPPPRTRRTSTNKVRA